MIPLMTTTMARRLNQGLGLCATSFEEAGACMDTEGWFIAEALAMLYPVFCEAQPATYSSAM